MGERKAEKHQNVVAPHTPPTRDLTHNPGLGPDWESNQWPFGSQAGAPLHHSSQRKSAIFNPCADVDSFESRLIIEGTEEFIWNIFVN